MKIITFALTIYTNSNERFILNKEYCCITNRAIHKIRKIQYKTIGLILSNFILINAVRCQMIEHSAKQCQRIATPYIEKTNSHLCEQFSNDINISGLVVLCDYYNIIMIIFVMFERRKWFLWKCMRPVTYI